MPRDFNSCVVKHTLIGGHTQILHPASYMHSVGSLADAKHSAVLYTTHNIRFDYSNVYY